MNNDKIEELCQAAMVTKLGHGAFGEPENYLQLDPILLAKLIIEECNHIIHEEEGMSYYGDNGKVVTTDVIIRKINEHFGITS